jgi:hypothetical protein
LYATHFGEGLSSYDALTIVRLDTTATNPFTVLEQPTLPLHTSRADQVSALWHFTTASDTLQLNVYEDIQRFALQDGVNLDSEVSNSTMLIIIHSTRISLVDAKGFVNSDQRLRESIRSTADTRFAIVTQTIDGDDLGLLFAGGFVANTLEIRGSYVHVRYSCPAIDGKHRAGQ